VFGTLIFGARETLDMPSPGELRPARFSAVVHDPVWEGVYAPIANVVSATAARLNGLQFLTIRAYLTLVFLVLILLLIGIAIWR
jgi:hypothetical protein